MSCLPSLETIRTSHHWHPLRAITPYTEPFHVDEWCAKCGQRRKAWGDGADVTPRCPGFPIELDTVQRVGL